MSWQPEPNNDSFGQKCWKAYHPLKMIPFLSWIQSYQLSWVIPDFVAGITVCFMLIPQGPVNFVSYLDKFMKKNQVKIYDHL